MESFPIVEIEGEVASTVLATTSTAARETVRHNEKRIVRIVFMGSKFIF